MKIFERYLTIWVSLCIILGILLGKFFPILPNTLKSWEYANAWAP